MEKRTPMRSMRSASVQSLGMRKRKSLDEGSRNRKWPCISVA